ncbi:redoxin [mine drainage metagenome]|uniref:Redoxin n=1 Tax=mine drainage metagenome TaxID=410659 RepID=A0A1J5R555_9ZZZZ
MRQGGQPLCQSRQPLRQAVKLPWGHAPERSWPLSSSCFPPIEEHPHEKILLLTSILLAAPLTAFAAQPFTASAFATAQSAFATAQSAGKSILVNVSAPWCPTCAKQTPIIATLERKPPDLVVFKRDFDHAKDALARSTGATDAAADAAAPLSASSSAARA